MNRQLFHTKAHFYLAILIAFSLPFAQLSPIFIGLMLLNWLIEADFKNKFKMLSKNRLALLFISFYVIHLVGLSYTQNIDSGLFDIQVKFSLLIFPLLIATRPLNEKNKNNIFFSFTAGAIIVSLLMLIRAVYLYFSIGENDFFYGAFSFLIHPSYLSMYVNFILGGLFLKLFNNKKAGAMIANKWIIFIILFLSFITVLLSSKMGLLTIILIYIGFLIYFVVSRKKYLFGIVGLLVLGISIFASLKLLPEMARRIYRSIDAVTSSSTDKAEKESTAVRLLIWKAADQVISENLISGVGTGDAKDALMNEYEKRGMSGALENKLNSHNEFYQVFLALGLIGFILLLANLFFPLFVAFQTSNWIYILFLFIIMINYISESMLETQAGVIFFAFFNSLLCFSSSDLNIASKIKHPKLL